MSFRLSHIHDYNRFIAIDLGLYRTRVGIYDFAAWVLSCTGFSSVRQSRKNFLEWMVVDIWGIWDSVEQAMIQASENMEDIPDDIIMSFPSQSFISDLLTTQYSRDDQDSALTMQEIDTMIKRIEKSSYERARTKSRKKFGVISDDLKLISSTIISIQIDGKNVSSPIWFSGRSIRLTILNVFVPSGEFNIMRSVVSQLGKKIISLIPEPLILPKLIEETDAITQNTCIIDIGYTHTTVTVLQKNEVIWFETFAYWTAMLMECIALYNPQYSLLQIENLICNPNEFHSGDNQEYLHEFLEYIQDAIFGYFQAESIDLKFNFLFFHGSIFENKTILYEFGKLMENSFGYDIKKKCLYEALEPKIKYDQCVIHWLSLMAKELLLVKKDPLIRILRYVLYQYE
jgi:hypothetical protein